MRRRPPERFGMENTRYSVAELRASCRSSVNDNESAPASSIAPARRPASPHLVWETAFAAPRFESLEGDPDRADSPHGTSGPSAGGRHWLWGRPAPRCEEGSL